jgi:YNFM family putative membrane transporter
MSAAFFIAGFGTFALIYDVQPLLPEFPADFAVSPATASLALSATTLTLSASMLAAGRISELVDRRRLMGASIILGGVVSIASAFAPSWGAFLALRALLGATLGGLPAVALAYIADNVPPARLAATVGLYVSGTAFGGMAGRLLGGFLTEASQDWRHTVGIIGALCLLAGVLFYLALPARDSRGRSHLPVARASRPHAPRAPAAPARSVLTAALARYLAQWRDPVLRRLFIEGGLLLGCFVATFNYLCFRLAQSPYNFTHGQISLVFLMNLIGMVVSPLCGRLISRFGLAAVLRASFLVTFAGCLLSLPPSPVCLLLGCALGAAGFFAGHSTATAWVNRRAETGRAIASAQYLTTYYIGASLLGWLGGWAWQWLAWPGVALLVATVALTATLLVPKAPSQK